MTPGTSVFNVAGSAHLRLGIRIGEFQLIWDAPFAPGQASALGPLAPRRPDGLRRSPALQPLPPESPSSLPRRNSLPISQTSLHPFSRQGNSALRKSTAICVDQYRSVPELRFVALRALGASPFAIPLDALTRLRSCFNSPKSKIGHSPTSAQTNSGHGSTARSSRFSVRGCVAREVAAFWPSVALSRIVELTETEAPYGRGVDLRRRHRPTRYNQSTN